MSALATDLFVRGLAQARAYRAPVQRSQVDLFLASNEGRGPFPRYPSQAQLQAELAARHGLPPERALVTAGGDDLLFRACLATLEPGREALVAAPTFEMIPRYVALAGGTLVTAPWTEERFPIEAVRARVTERTRLVFLVTPNNPTGAAANADDLAQLLEAAPSALIVVDHAYVEFADVDLTQQALASSRCVVLRTLSKAWGLAGLRVGYGLGASRTMAALAAAGSPFPVSAPSLAHAAARLATGSDEVAAYIARVREEREVLRGLLAERGAVPLRSHANFVFARVADAPGLRDALAERGIAIRAFPDRPEIADAVRITCPGEPAAFERLSAALGAALTKERGLIQ